MSVGQTQDITAFGVCKKVTLNSVPVPSAGVAGICVPTNVDAAQWASFYNNPPSGVTVAECAAGCTGYVYGGYCYYTNSSAQQSCDATCATHGGCDVAGTRYIGSDDSSASRCSAVVTGITGTSVTASPEDGTSGPYPDGCAAWDYKGGWLAGNYYAPPTTCAAADSLGRICACSAPPTALSLTHNVRSRVFAVSWTAGSGNGGAGGCRLEYLKNGSTWTALTGSYNCDANASGGGAQFPTTTGWTNNFNATGVQVRLVRVADSAVMGTFTQKATCTSTSASSSPTPDIDENCNGNWDDAASIYKGNCNGTYSGSFGLGGAYSCDAPAACSGYTDIAFYRVDWSASSVLLERWANGSCSGSPYFSNVGNPFATSSAQSGSAPTQDANGFLMNGSCHALGGNTQRLYGSSGWSSATCTFRYYDTGYN